MAKEQPEKLTGTSLDISAENRTRLKALFPAVFTETRNDKGDLVESIDFEKLKAELGTFSDLFESRRERYGMDWPGKKEALRLIQTPSAATLRPCREESVNFDTTGNLFIEGDNLEVLKLLQNSYYDKVKMIVIDPPYNTGKEFIYPDNFSESLETYLQYAGLIDGDGKKFSTNTTNEGRFHTKWLNMMYPRLYLARNLLKDDGVIFISIDDNELNNLRKLCDEIFGEENFGACFVVKSNPRGSQSNSYCANVHEYVLCYLKNSASTEALSIEMAEQMVQEYSLEDKSGKYRLMGLRMRGGAWRREERPFLYYPIFIDESDGSVSFIRTSESQHEVYPIKPTTGEDGTWRWSKKKAEEQKTKVVAKKVARDNKSVWDIFQKDYLNDGESQKTTKAKTIWDDKEINYQNGTNEIKSLFDNKGVFTFPKPTFLIKRLIELSDESNALILDFFAGSATTAHAMLDLNKQDNGNRKFILIQLPEPCGEGSEAFKAGYKTIADIGKERIRRVIKKIEDERATQDKKNSEALPGMLKEQPSIDLGFKVLKLNKSNFKPWQKLDPSAPVEKIEKQLELHIDHINPEATPEDLLYEILLKAGFPPTKKIETKIIAGINVFSVSEGGLLFCLEKPVAKELIDAVAEAEPMRFICLDSAFHGNDQLKANSVQTFAARNMQREKHNKIIFKTV